MRRGPRWLACDPWRFAAAALRASIPRRSPIGRHRERDPQTNAPQSAYAGSRGRAKGKYFPLTPAATTSCWSVRRALARPFIDLTHYRKRVVPQFEYVASGQRSIANATRAIRAVAAPPSRAHSHRAN
jgi:hypothetical protein